MGGGIFVRDVFENQKSRQSFSPRRDDFLGALNKPNRPTFITSNLGALDLTGGLMLGVAGLGLLAAFLIAGYRPRRNPRRRWNTKLTPAQRLRVPTKLPRGHRAKFGTGSLDDDRAYQKPRKSRRRRRRR